MLETLNFPLILTLDFIVTEMLSRNCTYVAASSRNSYKRNFYNLDLGFNCPLNVRNFENSIDFNFDFQCY